MLGPARVLVACRANICRSPLGAALLQRHADARLGPGGVEVVSAGTHARAGLPATDEVRRIATSWELDLDEHRSQVLDATGVASADLVVTMSESQRARVVMLIPSALPRTFTWRELARLSGQPAAAGDLPPTERLEPLWERDRGPVDLAPAMQVAALTASWEADPRGRIAAAATRLHHARPYVPAAAEPEDVADPYGRERADYVTMANQLVHESERFVPFLLGAATPTY